MASDGQERRSDLIRIIPQLDAIQLELKLLAQETRNHIKVDEQDHAEYNKFIHGNGSNTDPGHKIRMDRIETVFGHIKGIWVSIFVILGSLIYAVYEKVTKT